MDFLNLGISIGAVNRREGVGATLLVDDAFDYADNAALRAVWLGYTSSATADNARITVVGGKMRVESISNGRGVRALTAMTIGVQYFIEVDYAAVSHDVGYIRIGTAADGSNGTSPTNYDLAGTGNGTKRVYFTANATTMYVSLWSNTGTTGQTVDYDNFKLWRP